MTSEEKAIVKKAKTDFNLHVAMLIRDGAPKPDAIVLAYAEGKAGLDRRFPNVVAPLPLPQEKRT